MAPPRVLVVDDEPVNLQVVVNHLHPAGFSVETAENGSRALALIETGGFDLVILDIMMPRMTGYEVCRRLRQTYSASSLPVVMLTAKNRVADLVAGFTAGANDYLTKPFARDELLARVRTQLKLKQAYETLSENIRLKKELDRRKQTVLELRLMQRRLGLLLDAVDDAVLAVNAADEIGFCNAAVKALLGRDTDDLLGRPAGELFDPPSTDWLDGLREAFENDPGGAPPPRSWRPLFLAKPDGGRIPVKVIATPLDLDGETLQVLILRRGAFDEVPAGVGEKATADPAKAGKEAPKLPVMAVIDELNRNQSRLRGVALTLSGLLPRTTSPPPGVLTEIRAIDRALASVGSALIADKGEDRRRLAVAVMNHSLDYWREATDTDKFDLARQSGIWKVYTNKDGWQRAQTLDRYLSYETIPRQPRWSWVSDTAIYVLTACDKDTPLRRRLETALDRLRFAVS